MINLKESSAQIFLPLWNEQSKKMSLLVVFFDSQECFRSTSSEFYSLLKFEWKFRRSVWVEPYVIKIWYDQTF